MHKGPMTGKGVECNFADESLLEDFVDNCVLRGFIAELGIGPEVGGSTITQQVPRTLDVMKRAGLNSGFGRIVAKYKEWILAYRMEQEFTKEEILELYLNTSFFGQRS